MATSNHNNDEMKTIIFEILEETVTGVWRGWVSKLIKKMNYDNRKYDINFFFK